MKAKVLKEEEDEKRGTFLLKVSNIRCNNLHVYKCKN